MQLISVRFLVQKKYEAAGPCVCVCLSQTPGLNYILSAHKHIKVQVGANVSTVNSAAWTLFTRKHSTSE